MANPLQPKVIARLEKRHSAYVVKVTSASKSGTGDILACIFGQFFMFEVKWASDVPSELQKDKINRCLDAGGKAFFVRSVEELDKMVSGEIKPTYYKDEVKFKL